MTENSYGIRVRRHKDLENNIALRIVPRLTSRQNPDIEFPLSSSLAIKPSYVIPPETGPIDPDFPFFDFTTTCAIFHESTGVCNVGSNNEYCRKKNAPSEEPLFQSIGMLAPAVGHSLTKLLHDQLDLMSICGLSEALCYNVELKRTITTTDKCNTTIYQVI